MTHQPHTPPQQPLPSASPEPQKGRRAPDAKEGILMRASLLHLVFVLMALCAIGAVIYLQFGPDAQKLKDQAVDYSFRNEIIEAARGDILSDDYRTLATSIVYYDLRMDMMAAGLTVKMFNDNVGALATGLSQFFKDKAPDEYRIMLTTAYGAKKRFVRLSNKKVDYLQLQQLRTLPLLKLPPNVGGFIPQEIGQRANPHGALAWRTIGFVNKVGAKVGLEGSFNDQLRGRDGITVKQKISGDFWIPIASDLNVEPVNGENVVTTINIEIQDIAQRVLVQRLLDTEADWGTAIVMDVKTGHIKALANATRTSDGKIVEDYNYAIGMSMEPGSTFKLAGYLALLEAGASPSEMYHTGGGTMQIGYTKVVDSRTGGYGSLTLQGVFEHSSNIGMALAVNRYYGSKPGKFSEFLGNLGLNKEFGLQIPGEAKPLIKHPSLKNGWDGMTLTMMSYGYAVRITPIQTLALYNAVANNGRMVKPQFVTELRSQGKVVRTFPTEVVKEKICSDATLRNAQRALAGVVTDGTARTTLLNDKYSVAAKTGTAQVAMGRSGYGVEGGARHYLGSLVGYFPVENPRYTILVALKTFYSPGSGKSYYGASLAGPVFRDIADQIYSYDFALHKPNVSESTMPQKTQKLSADAGDGTKLQSLARTLGLALPETTGQPMAAIDSGRVAVRSLALDSTGVPNMRGVALPEAIATLQNSGYTVRVNGRGSIYNQILAVDSITRRRTVILHLKR